VVIEHLSGYQARDHEVIDYQMVELPQTGLQFRGPLPHLEPGEYFTCLGAAQTFGCFCEQPYPQLLASATRRGALNLGYGGAGPRFFNRHAELIEYANRGRFAIVQVMSARSEDNNRFESLGLELLTRRRDGRQFSADQAWRDVLECRYAWRKTPWGRSLARRICHWWGRQDARRLVQQNRRNWLGSYQHLLSSLKVPKLLLWFSQRGPDYQEDYRDVLGLFGAFPQLVNRAMVEQVARDADAYVECTTHRGMPQPLISRFDGQPVEIDLARDRSHFEGRVWTQNVYYPSPEMHADAASLLAEKLAAQGW
jgi:hypothetical protein